MAAENMQFPCIALRRLRVLSAGICNVHAAASVVSSTTVAGSESKTPEKEQMRRPDTRQGHQVPKELLASRGSAVEYLETGARRPTQAEKAVTLLQGQRQGFLSTVSRDVRCTGFPFGSMVNIARGAKGELLTFLSKLAEHRLNLESDSRCSLLVAEGQGGLSREGGDPLSHARATLLGRLELVEKTSERRSAFLGAHPGAFYVDFDDFGCFSMQLDSIVVRYIGGFGEMSWVEGPALAAAEPDLVSAGAAGAVEHMNSDHADATVAILRSSVRGLESASAARILSMDRYGFEALAELPGGARRVRMAFLQALSGPEEIKEAILALLRRARSQEQR